MKIFFLLLSLPIFSYCQTLDTALTDSTFLGISVGRTSFEAADSILAPFSYQKPKKAIRSIRFQRGCSTQYVRHYYINTSESKLELILTGLGTVDQLELLSRGQAKDVFHHNVILGKTKARELTELMDKEWETEIGCLVDEKSTRTIAFQGIQIAVEGNENEIESSK